MTRFRNILNIGIVFCAILLLLPLSYERDSSAKDQGSSPATLQQQPEMKQKEPSSQPPALIKPLSGPPINLRLLRLGQRLYLDTGASPDRVDLLVDGRLLKRLSGGGKTRFDLTPFLGEIPRGRMTVHAYNRVGTRFEKNFDVSSYQKALKTFPETPEAPKIEKEPTHERALGPEPIKPSPPGKPVPMILERDETTSIMRVPLRLLTPNGGENWGQRTAHEIIWSGGGNVVVELLRDGRPIETIRGEPRYDRQDRNYRILWFIRGDQEIGRNYRVRLTHLGTSESDESDANFEIRAQRAGDTNILVHVDPSRPGMEPGKLGAGKKLPEEVRGDVQVTTACDDTFCRGSSMSYRIQSGRTGFVYESGPVTVSSCNRTTSFLFERMVPEADDYITTVNYGACFGMSERFSLGTRPSRSLEVYAPYRFDRWYRGTAHRIEWYDTDPTSKNRRITLMNGYDEVIEISATSIGYDASSQRYFVDWVVPDLRFYSLRASDQFSIRIQSLDRSREDHSDFFSIPTNGIEFLQPTRGSTYYRLNFLPVSWRVIGHPEDRVHITLNRYMEPRINIARNQQVDSSLAPIFLDPGLIPAGKGYWLLAENYSGNVVGESDVFNIINPILQMTNPHGEGLIFRMGDRMTISWRAQHFPPGSGVRGTADLVLPTGAAVTICNDLDLNRGSFTWTVGVLGRCPDEPLVGKGWTGAAKGTAEGRGLGANHRIRIRVNRLPEVWVESSMFTVD